MLKKRDNRDKEEVKSILSPELKVEGNIYAQGKVRIDGVVEGNVEGDFLIFGESAKVNGNIKAEKVIVMGNINGDIVAKEAQIKSSAKLKGSVDVKELSVEEGASVEGNLRCGEFTEREAQNSSLEKSSQ